MNMRLTGVDWRPFQKEFPILFGAGKFVSLWVGEGWFQILWSLCMSLERIGRARIAEGHRPMRVVQIKEKYGSLRVYVEDGTDEAFDLIDSAETASETTCEACGKPGNTHCIGGWDKTLCVFHELESRLSTRSRSEIGNDDSCSFGNGS